MSYGSPVRQPTSPTRSGTTRALASHHVHRRGSTLTTTFRSLGILPETAEALEAVGITTPFPIQELTLPVALSGTDVIGQAKTGTGKTLGFGLPLLERVTVPADVEAGRAAPESLTDAPQALVVVPTRELCQQVTNDLLTAGKVRNVRVTAIYGGRAYEPQVEALKKGVDVIVGTPGRLLDLAGQKKLSLKHVKCLVLDEADEMLDLGFLPDVEKIINLLPARRQTMLFSATMPGAVIGLARRYMSQPTHIRATSPDDAGATVANTKQFVYRAHNMDKPEMVARILQADGRGLAMVFCRTKRTAADLADQLKQRGFASGAVHGDLGQGAREQALRAFRNGKVDVLVCTDVAARGIDVEGVTHVINYQSPEEEKTYLHRIGRTGRAGAKGTAITLVDWDDIPRWQLINKALDLGFNDPAETYSTSPHFYTDLGIPEGTKGVLPRSERTRAGLDAEELEDLGEPGGRGGRGRGDRGDRGGRGGRDDARSGDRERDRSSRTPRRRRRMRGGAPVDAETSAAPVAEAVTGGADGAADAATDAAQGPRTLRRRRRTRSGEPSRRQETRATLDTDAPAAQTAEDAALAPSEAPVVETAEATELVEAPAKPRRRRTRKSAEAAPATPLESAPPAAEATVVETPKVVEAPAAETPAEKPRRRTRKATAAEAALDTAEGATDPASDPAETKPRRRTRKAAAVDAGAVQAPEEAAAEAKPRRTRKTAAAKAEAAADTVEATEAKPKTRRTRKATEPTEVTEAAADIPAQPAQAPEEAAAETKPRRTRKTAAAKAEAAADTVEGAEAKPKTRRTRKAAEPAVPAPEEAAAAESKPRRTRKTAAAKAEAAADTVEGAEAKPKARRARKTAAAPEAAAEIPAQASQEPEAAPRRRTRKAAAATTVEATAATADPAEAKPKARRTRKTAAAATQPAEGGES
ncbi:DEAD/DEAH box helicase [Streptomyces sp. RS2]|uniref:DEAD/DEAH box helicase n=1 Tax=Streptomyces sp. RS2 TaxID=1451205 RepID=UPI0021F8F8DD|nr:DEAD/DEAH box helicase [Streptomyces sp. RS2]MCW1096334.1 DEAD/DEAH box helicase [Streptomyces sp. RS2]